MRHGIGVALAALALATPSIATAQLAQNNQHNATATGINGQSFTVVGTGSFNNIVLSYQNFGGGNVGVGTVYLFSMAYTGTPTDLAIAPNSIGSASFSGGTFTFAPGMQLTGGLQYFAYNDTAFSVRASISDPYPGGIRYFSTGNSTYQESPEVDLRFTVTGTAATPEPAAWALLILGFGVAGSALRRRAGGRRGGMQKI